MGTARSVLNVKSEITIILSNDFAGLGLLFERAGTSVCSKIAESRRGEILNPGEKRLFTAIRCTEEVREVLERNAKVLADAGSIRLTRRENFHLTLIYIGETSREQDVRAALRDLISAPFELTFSAAGMFRRPEGLLLWQGVELGPELLALYKQLNENLCWRGFCSPNVSYKPHITLGRRFRPQNGLKAEEVLRDLEIPPVMPVESVSLFESKRVNGLLVYEEIDRLMLHTELI